MRTKGVSVTAVTSERSTFNKKKFAIISLSNLPLIPLVSVVWGLSVVGGIGGMQMTAASERSIFSENYDYKFFPVSW